MASKYKTFYVYAPVGAVPDIYAVSEDVLIGAPEPAQVWTEACVVDASFDGSWEEEDVTDTCSRGLMESHPTVRSSQIEFDCWKKNATNPTWYVSLLTAWETRIPIMLMMLDDLNTQSGADGVVLIAHVFDFKLSHPTKGINKVEFTAKPAGTVAGLKLSRLVTL